MFSQAQFTASNDAKPPVEFGPNAPDIALNDAPHDAHAHSLVQELIQRLSSQAAQSAARERQLNAELLLRQTKIDALILEIRLLRHHRFGSKTEAMDRVQAQLFEEAHAEDLASAEQQLSQLAVGVPSAAPKAAPKRQALPAELPRIDIAHEPADTECQCGQPLSRISQDISERLDFVPGTFRVERHIRGVWACKCCQKLGAAQLRQEPMPAQIIDAGLPTAGLLAQVLVAKYDDHLPLYRQSEIYARSGVELSRSTLADWVGACGVALAPIVQALKAQLLQSQVLHADESPLVILGNKGDKKRGYIWAYASGEREAVAAVVFQIKDGRSGQHAKDFLCHEAIGPPGGQTDAQRDAQRWRGHLVVDDYAGYKQLFVPSSSSQLQPQTQPPILEVACWAHVRRKFFELHVAAKSDLAKLALDHIAALYATEREIKGEGLDLERALARRQTQSLPRLLALHAWLLASREQITDGTGTAKAMDYALRRWPALVRYAHDARLPMDNNRIENQIRPWAVGRKNWMFAGSLAAGQRAADIMSLIQTAKMNGIEPFAYLRDVLKRLPTHPNRRIEELLPTVWRPQTASCA
jgi:transposase